MSLTAERLVDFATSQETREYPVAAGVRIYRGANVGVRPDGYAVPYVSPYKFLGIALEEQNNTSGSNGSLTVSVRSAGDAVVTLSSVALLDVGRAVYATDDDAQSFRGHPDAFMGRVSQYLSSTTALVRLRLPGQLPTPNDKGSIELIWEGTKDFAEVLTAGNETRVDGWRLDSIGAGITTGAGIAPAAGKPGVTKMLLDNDNEAENLTIESPAVFDAQYGISMEFVGHLATAGGAATDDFDFGLVTAANSAITDGIRANMDVTTSGIRHLKVHNDANAADFFAGSDDDTTVVGPTDTTIDNVTTADTFKKWELLIKPSGVGEIYCDGVRVLSSTSFSVGTSITTLFAAIVNLEKSTGTGVPEVRVQRIRAAGAGVLT